VMACTEPRGAPVVSTPAPALEARLELSDSMPRAGESLFVRLRLTGPGAAKIVSFTGHVAFDSSALRYVSESAPVDGATRASNPAPGFIRAAAVRANGFVDGLLAEYRFVVVRPEGVGRLTFGIDELHDQSRVDASKSVVVRGRVGATIP
jgi:hypothetical protein